MNTIEVKRQLLEDALNQLRWAQNDYYVQGTQKIIDELEGVLYKPEGDVPKVTGTMLIDFIVQCPHCKENLDQSENPEWFQKTMGQSFPADGTDADYEATCPECEKEFIIKGFCN